MCYPPWHKWNEWNTRGFRPSVGTCRLNWAREISQWWWDECDDTALQTQVWGRARYISVTETPHSIESLWVSGEETFWNLNGRAGPMTHQHTIFICHVQWDVHAPYDVFMCPWHINLIFYAFMCHNHQCHINTLYYAFMCHDSWHIDTSYRIFMHPYVLDTYVFKGSYLQLSKVADTRLWHQWPVLLRWFRSISDSVITSTKPTVWT